MALSSSARYYSMSDADLCMFVSNLVNIMIRDETEFAVYGVSPADTTAFKALGDAFEVFPPDIIYLGDVGIATEDKNVKVDAIRIGIRSISVRAESKWGANSARYRKFGVLGMNKLTDLNLLNCARRVIRVGNIFLTELASEGLTQQILDDFEVLTESFESSLNTLEDAISDRDIKTEERILKGNELFSFVSKYCNFGKRIWESVNEAKYNDYVIHPSTHHGLSKPKNVAANYDPLNPPKITLTWDLVSEATSYDVYYDIAETRAPAGDFEFLNNYSTSPIVIQAIFEKRNYYKIKAKNNKNTSSYSDEAWVDVPAEPAG